MVARVVRERTEGTTAYAIARGLNKDAVPIAQGSRAWSQASAGRAVSVLIRSVVVGHRWRRGALERVGNTHRWTDELDPVRPPDGGKSFRIDRAGQQVGELLVEPLEP